MMIDYHIHTSRCGHARGKMSEYVEEARKKGLAEMGFSDHGPMYWLTPDLRDPGLAMAEDEFPRYLEEVSALGKMYPDVNIRLGVELDYIPGFEKQAARLLSGLPLDYVYGSVHFIGGWAFDSPRQLEEYGRRDIKEVYRQYFNLLCGAADTGLFDIMAHPDLVKKFGHRPAKELTELYLQAARTFARAGVCVEVNTAGLRWPAGEIYPSAEFLWLCQREGVPAVTGSDAHDPESVALDFHLALALLKEAGYRKVALFRDRQRRLAPITEINY